MANKILLSSSCLLLFSVVGRVKWLTYCVLCTVMMNKYLFFISKGRGNYVWQVLEEEVHMGACVAVWNSFGRRNYTRKVLVFFHAYNSTEQSRSGAWRHLVEKHWTPSLWLKIFLLWRVPFILAFDVFFLFFHESASSVVILSAFAHHKSEQTSLSCRITSQILCRDTSERSSLIL